MELEGRWNELESEDRWVCTEEVNSWCDLYGRRSCNIWNYPQGTQRGKGHRLHSAVALTLGKVSIG